MSYPDESLDLRYLGRVLARYRWLILVNAVLAGIAAAAVTKYCTTPMYKAEATVLIPSGGASPLSSFLASAGLGGLAGSPGGQGDILAVLKSRNTAEKVVRELKLRDVYNAPTDRIAAMSLQGAVSVQMGPEGQLLIDATAKSGKLAADIANAYPRVLNLYRQSEDGSSAQRNLRFIERQLVRTRGELEAAEEQLRRFQQGTRVVNMESKSEQTLARLNAVETELATLEISLREQRERLAALQPKMRDRTLDPVAPAPSSQVDRLRGKLADLQAEYLINEYSYQADHPKMRELRQSIEVTKEQIQQWVEKSLSAVDRGNFPEIADLQVNTIAAEAREAALNAEIGRLKQQAEKLPTTILEFSRLKRAVSAKDQVYQMLLQELYKAQITADRATLPARILDEAVAPGVPFSPKPKRNIMLGVFAGLFIGIVLAFFLNAVNGPDAPLPAPRRFEAEERETPRRREKETARRE